MDTVAREVKESGAHTELDSWTREGDVGAAQQVRALLVMPASEQASIHSVTSKCSACDRCGSGAR